MVSFPLHHASPRILALSLSLLRASEVDLARDTGASHGLGGAAGDGELGLARLRTAPAAVSLRSLRTEAAD